MPENNKATLTGTIVKLIGGIYFVDASESVFECTARGVFRKRGITPSCGDKAVIEVTGENTAVITEICERKNEIIRPPMANLDNLVFVSSTCEPAPNLKLLDMFIAVAEYKGINPVVVFTKTDLSSPKEYCEIYEKCGIEVYCIDNSDGKSCLALKERLVGKISAFTGNTGVGKTSLLNNMFPDLNLKTQHISRKLGRGKHTTRHVEFYKLSEGGYIADTPGFSSFDTNRYDIIFKDELADCFKEFSPFLGKCRFVNCSHTKEIGCEIIKHVENGDIPRSRHESYVEMYKNACEINEWEYKKK